MTQSHPFQSIVAETLLIPLHMRAKESRRKNPILYDPAAERLAESLDYDYSPFDGARLSEVGCVVRGWYFDNAVRRFIRSHIHPVVVNVGCGLDTLRARHPEASFIFVMEGVLMYFYEKQVRSFLHHVASRFGGGEIWFDVCGTMMSKHGVKPDSLRHHEAQIRSGLSNGRLVEQWEPALHLLDQANYMKFFRRRWGFFFGQILGRIPWLCYRFSSLLGYEIRKE